MVAIRLLFFMISMLISYQAFAGDAVSTNLWVKSIANGWDVASERTSVVDCGRTVYYAFGPLTGHTADQATSMLNIACPNGADLFFDPDVSQVGVDGLQGSIILIYTVIGSATDEQSEPLPNSDVIEPVSLSNTSAYGVGKSNPAYGLSPGNIFIDYDASATAGNISLIRVRGR